MGDPPPVCPHRVLGCMPFIALAYFFLWYLPPFTNLRGLWYMTFYCLFQALSTVSRAACLGLGPWNSPAGEWVQGWVSGGSPAAPAPQRLAVSSSSRPRGSGLGAPAALAPDPGPEGSRGDVPASRGPGWDRRPLGGLGGGGRRLSSERPSSSRCPTRRSPCC